MQNQKLKSSAPFTVSVKVNLTCLGGRVWFCWHSHPTEGFMSVHSTKITLTLWGKLLCFLNIPLNVTLLRLHEIAVIPNGNTCISRSVNWHTAAVLQCFVNNSSIFLTAFHNLLAGSNTGSMPVFIQKIFHFCSIAFWNGILFLLVLLIKLSIYWQIFHSQHGKTIQNRVDISSTVFLPLHLNHIWFKNPVNIREVPWSTGALGIILKTIFGSMHKSWHASFRPC